MSDRVLPLHANVHRTVDALLPWHVNGTLRGAEQDLVTRHLDECSLCRREVEWLRELHAACAACVADDAAARMLAAPQRRRSTAARGTLWRVAAAAQLVVIAVLAWQLRSSSDDTTALYRTLGTQGAGATANVVVVFDASASERQMRELLQSVGGRIVGGPTPAQGYLVAVPAAVQARAIEALRAARIVNLAEPLGAAAAR